MTAMLAQIKYSSTLIGNYTECFTIPASNIQKGIYQV